MCVNTCALDAKPSSQVGSSSFLPAFTPSFLLIVQNFRKSVITVYHPFSIDFSRSMGLSIVTQNFNPMDRGSGLERLQKYMMTLKITTNLQRSPSAFLKIDQYPRYCYDDNFGPSLVPYKTGREGNQSCIAPLNWEPTTQYREGLIVPDQLAVIIAMPIGSITSALSPSPENSQVDLIATDPLVPPPLLAAVVPFRYSTFLKPTFQRNGSNSGDTSK